MIKSFVSVSVLLLLQYTFAFTTTQPARGWCKSITSSSGVGDGSSTATRRSTFQRSQGLSSSSSTLSWALSASSSSAIVISAANGVGQVAAVKAAEQGSRVRWFVVNEDNNNDSSNNSNNSVTLSQQSLQRIQQAGGQLDIAGGGTADKNSLSDSSSVLTSWFGTSNNALVCTMDGITTQQGQDIIKIAAREAAKTIESSGYSIAIVGANDNDADDDEDDNDSDKMKSDNGESGSGGIGSLVGGLLGLGSQTAVPASLREALSGTNMVTVRHGELFGMPESSPDFSALVGGLRKDPVLCEEYRMRMTRVDWTVSASGNRMMTGATKSSRHAVGEAAALISLGKVSVAPEWDVCIASQLGTDPFTVQDWQKEFERIAESIAKSTASGRFQLFSTEFGSVPDTERLADWLHTKWAPAVLRTYDLASIRTGARPVYSIRVGKEDEDGSSSSSSKLEIIWQELVNFESANTGKMMIEVTDKGIVATRGPGDANKGFGTVSKKPLPGEDVLVRRLSEAASQAVEKGLAKKVAVKKPVVVVEVAAPEPVVVAAAPTVTTIQASGPVVATASGEDSSAGPRKAGARRSAERQRGRQRKQGSESDTGVTSSSDDNNNE